MLLVLIACTSHPLSLSVDSALRPAADSAPDFDGGTRELARFQYGDHAVDFAIRDLIVDADGANALADRLGGEVVHTLDPADFGVAGPPVAVVRLPEDATAAGDVDAAFRDLAPGATGDVTVSSDAGYATLAQAVLLADSGIRAGLDFRVEEATFTDNSSLEGSSDFGNEAFAWPHLGEDTPQGYGVSLAWQALELTGRLDQRVPVAIVDHEILDGRDYEGDLRVQTDNTEDSARFHGTKVASILASPADDERGGAGVAGPIADLRLYEGNEVFLNGQERVVQAAGEGARVINLSWGVDWPDAFKFLLDIQSAMIAAAAGDGTMVVAAAGNDGQDITAHDGWFDTESTYDFPCEVEEVVCVAGEAWNSTARDPDSNFGSTVDLYGPFTVLISAPDGSGSVEAASGTSFASPFVAGAAALVLAADPSLTTSEVLGLLQTTGRARRGTNPAVDVNAAVRAALGAVPPNVHTNVSGFLHLEACEDITLSATVEDDETSFTYTWESNLDGRFSVDAVTSTATLRPGVQTITLTVADPGGAATVDFFSIELPDGPPTLALSNPTASTCDGQSVRLLSTASDCDFGDTLSYAWTEGSRVLSTEAQPELTFTTGTHYLGVSVTDESGVSDSAAATVFVYDCAGNAPEVTITAPDHDTTSLDYVAYTGFDDARGLFYADVPVAATAEDVEDGTMSDLRWTTDRTDLQDADLLTGAFGTVRLYGECWGDQHVLTTTTWDSDGNEGSATRIVYVETLC